MRTQRITKEEEKEKEENQWVQREWQCFRLLSDSMDVASIFQHRCWESPHTTLRKQ